MFAWRNSFAVFETREKKSNETDQPCEEPQSSLSLAVVKTFAAL